MLKLLENKTAGAIKEIAGKEANRMSGMLATALAGVVVDRRRDNIKKDINEAKDSFSNAIQNLELTEENNLNLERSMLDKAILLSLNSLELILYERIIDGKDVVKISKAEADDVGNGDWSKFVKNKTILKNLQKIREL